MFFTRSASLFSCLALATFSFSLQASEAPAVLSPQPAEVVGLNVPKSYESLAQMKSEGRYNELVRFKAEVRSIRKDNDLVVADASGKVDVDVNELPLPLKPGDQVIVTGRLDKETMSFEVSATQVEHGGKVYATPDTDP